ncbi:hypothetical protein QAD02_017371 [Eretmocerus hayati]|uniref:Uncharacterized protein n=1 Tax=Eretmocerus hayati TaxID=131215 RepID=A0ACC2PDA3_9HYME|nr:hypothetical protein QAD02_017371 [Eretmocerus hayati]
MVSAGMACVKYVLFLFNLIFAITGVALITVGTVIILMYNGYSNFVDIWLFAVPVLMIIIGIVVFVTSFCGCCGAVKESPCMIITFSVMLLLILVFEVGAGLSGYVMRSNLSSMLEKCMNNTLVDYNKRDDYRRSWDIIQYDFQCCGVINPSDWTKAGFRDDTLPKSCCTELPTSRPVCDRNAIKSHTEGCKKQFQNTIEKNGMILGVFGLGIALIQLVGVLFACCLARSVRREYETV